MKYILPWNIFIYVLYIQFFCFFWRNGIVRHLITFSNRSIISESASNTPVNIIFQISINNHTEELCPGGSQKNVTKENVLDYVRYCASVSLFYHSYEWRELNFISSIIVSLWYGKVPTGIYLFKFNNRNTLMNCWICLKLTIKRLEQRHWRH